jgi:hypothetical protein
MFMITERSEYVHNSEDDVGLRQKAAIEKSVNDDVDSDIDDSAYKYNDTWVNPNQACNSSEKSYDEAQESFETDLDGINNADEEVSMQENRDVPELS